jgi:phage-related holin
MLCSCSCGEDAENTCTSTNIQYYLILEVVSVVLNSIPICVGADLILEHLLVNVEVRVAAEVVVVFLVIVSQVSDQLLLELDVVEPGL